MARRVLVVGGTGFYAWGPGEAVEIETAEGPVALTHHRARGRDVFFLARHGPGHENPPHRVPYRAHALAMRAARVDYVVATFNVGALRTDLRPGAWLIPHDVLDLTTGRPRTLDPSQTLHVSMAEPLCPHVRRALQETAPGPVDDRGVYVATEGPRFETAAEAAAMRNLGGDVVGMTLVPEAVFARELGLCYGALAFVANAAGPSHEGDHARTIQNRTARQRGKLRAWITAALSQLPDRKRCACARASEGALLTPPRGGRTA